MVEEEQGRDVWVGANFALATLFMKNGMEKEAQEVLDTMSDIIYRRGFFFRTPEGWDTEGQFTATMYMRPNAVWALEF
jgi:non-lysosomal glucosylceramidase